MNPERLSERIARSRRRRAGALSGFTLVELLVSLAIMAMLMVLLVGVTGQTSDIWRRTTGKVEQFRGARNAFDTLTSRLSQATLNTYWDYDKLPTPTKYERKSELRFISGPASMLLAGTPIAANCLTHAVFFQAPFGLTSEPASSGSGLAFDGFENLLCTWGYYVSYDSDAAIRPAFLTAAGVPPRYRFRLMELTQPSEKNLLYSFTSGPGASPNISAAAGYNQRDWFTASLTASPPQVHMLTENVIALIIVPRLSQQDEAAVKGGVTSANADFSPLAPACLYDSSPQAAPPDSRYSDARLNPTNQLPPLLQVTMAVIDESSAVRAKFGAATQDPFHIQTKFQNSADYSSDLLAQSPATGAANADSLESALIAQHLNYRIFTSTIAIRGAKWSREQTN